MVTRVQILDEDNSTNTLGKGINPIILPPAMSAGQTGSSALVRQLV